MKKAKLLVLIFFTTFLLSRPTFIFAEAGLSEAGRTEFYKLTNSLALEVLPGGEGADGPDEISLVKYEMNPEYTGIKSICVNKYRIGTRLYSLGDHVEMIGFKDDTYIYISKEDELYSLNHEQVPELIRRNDIDSKTIQLTLSDIRFRYTKLPISLLDSDFAGLGCFILGGIGTALLLIIIFFITLFLLIWKLHMKENIGRKKLIYAHKKTKK